MSQIIPGEAPQGDPSATSAHAEVEMFGWQLVQSLLGFLVPLYRKTGKPSCQEIIRACTKRDGLRLPYRKPPADCVAILWILRASSEHD